MMSSPSSPRHKRKEYVSPTASIANAALVAVGSLTTRPQMNPVFTETRHLVRKCLLNPVYQTT